MVKPEEINSTVRYARTAATEEDMQWVCERLRYVLGEYDKYLSEMSEEDRRGSLYVFLANLHSYAVMFTGEALLHTMVVADRAKRNN